MRKDFEIINNWITENSHVVDLGCGDGSLFNYLQRAKKINGYGIDNDITQVNRCLQISVPVLQYDLEEWLHKVPSKSIDYVILSDSLQTLQRPDLTLKEMLRVGKKVVVSFPNMAYWYCRYHLLFLGKMPVSKSLPMQWYDTMNIHLCTIKDFEKLCKQLMIKRTSSEIVSGTPLLQTLSPNLGVDRVIYLLESGDPISSTLCSIAES